MVLIIAKILLCMLMAGIATITILASIKYFNFLRFVFSGDKYYTIVAKIKTNENLFVKVIFFLFFIVALFKIL